MMTKPQRVRWSRAWDRVDQALAGAIADIRATFEYCPPREASAQETKEEECEALAAEALRDAIGSIEGARSGLSTAIAQINWERTKAARTWSLRVVHALKDNREKLPPELLALLDDTSAPGDFR